MHSPPTAPSAMESLYNRRSQNTEHALGMQEHLQVFRLTIASAWGLSRPESARPLQLAPSSAWTITCAACCQRDSSDSASMRAAWKASEWQLHATRYYIQGFQG